MPDPTKPKGAALGVPSPGRRAASIGQIVRATKDEIQTATARTKPNSVKRRPAVDGRNEMGRKTEISVAVVASTAKNTWRVPSTAAARAAMPPRRRRVIFSSTTMASSTTRPAARTKASNVMRLIE